MEPDTPLIDVYYSPAGKACSDFEIEKTYQNYLVSARNVGHLYLTTSSMLLITRLRVGVVEKEIFLNVCYEDASVPVNNDGTIDWWGNIPDFHVDYLLRLVP